MSKPCYLYHICRKDDKWDFSKGYIGISRKPSKRWASGYNGSTHLKAAMKKYDDIIKYVVIFGSEKGCKISENRLRPEENMGWNIARGGGQAPSPKGKKHCVGNLPKEKRRRSYTPTIETRRKMSDSQRKIAHLNSQRMTDNNPMMGKSGELHQDFKGWYYTPAGKFGSATSAAKPNGLSSHMTVLKRCAEGSIIQRTRGLPRDWLGRTWRELGWYFEEKPK